jgi:hypothetical protein
VMKLTLSRQVMKLSLSRWVWKIELWMVVLLSAAVVLLALAALSDAFNWGWTGFPGNTFWDWLNLLLLPVTLTIATIWLSKRPNWSQTHTAIAVSGGVLFLILIIGGYMLNWTWTGFKGNTLWDWLHLLILPIMLSVLSVQLSARWQRAEETAQKS